MSEPMNAIYPGQGQKNNSNQVGSKTNPNKKGGQKSTSSNNYNGTAMEVEKDSKTQLLSQTVPFNSRSQVEAKDPNTTLTDTADDSQSHPPPSGTLPH